MKKIYLRILLLCVSGQLAAQTYPLRDKLNLVFAHIDKSQVPTGFLEEYGAPLVSLDVFNGILTDSNKVNIGVWRQAYATVQTSRIYGSNPLPNLSAVNTSLDNVEAANPGVLPVSLLYVDYNYLDMKIYRTNS